MNRLKKLLEEHMLLCTENWVQLNELSQLDTDKFSNKEKTDIINTITELELEYSMRKLFIADLEDLVCNVV